MTNVEPISGANFGAVVLLNEVHIDCVVFEANFEHLRLAAERWIALSHGHDPGDEDGAAPVDIVGYCTTCLSCLAALRRLLVSGLGNSVGDRRRRALTALIGNPSVPIVASATIRNSWEHLDERLDGLLPALGAGSIAPIHVSVEPPEVSTIALRRFDPIRMEIAYANQPPVNLVAALDEVRAIDAGVDKAFAHLRSNIVDPWA